MGKVNFARCVLGAALKVTVVAGTCSTYGANENITFSNQQNALVINKIFSPGKNVTNLQVVQYLNEVRWSESVLKTWEGMDLSNSSPKLADDTILEVIECFKSNPLTSVNLRNRIRFKPNTILQLAKKCGPKLFNLDISGCNQLTEKVLIEFAKRSENLKNVDLSGVAQTTDNIVSMLAQRNPLIENMNLDRCVEITGKGLEKLANVKNLNLESCIKLDNACLVEMANKCLSIQTLNLEGTQANDDAAIAVSKIPLLENLDLWGCPITDKAAQAISANSKNMKNCILGACDELTDDGVINLTKNTLIENLDLRCLQISNKAVKGLLNNGSHLQTLNLGCCYNVDDDIIPDVAKCSTLKSIWLSGTKITEKGEKLLREKRPDIKVNGK